MGLCELRLTRRERLRVPGDVHLEVYLGRQGHEREHGLLRRASVPEADAQPQPLPGAELHPELEDERARARIHELHARGVQDDRVLVDIGIEAQEGAHVRRQMDFGCGSARARHGDFPLPQGARGSRLGRRAPGDEEDGEHQPSCRLGHYEVTSHVGNL